MDAYNVFSTPINQFLSNIFKQLLNALASSKSFYLKKTARVYPTPIVILGHAKSGTTAIAKLLAKSSGRPATIDPVYRIDPNGDLNNRLFERDLLLSTFIQSHKFYFSTPLWKDPKLTFFYDELREYFPLAKYVFVIRDPRDTIRSFFNRRGIPGNLEDLPLPLETKLGGIARLPHVAGDNYIERAANRWNCATDVYMNHQDEFILIHYEDFLSNKAVTIHDLAKQVGLDPINDITADLNQQYQPKGNHNISWLQFFGKNNLQSIEEICSERMKHFGYRVSNSQ